MIYKKKDSDGWCLAPVLTGPSPRNETHIVLQRQAFETLGHCRRPSIAVHQDLSRSGIQAPTSRRSRPGVPGGFKYQSRCCGAEQIRNEANVVAEGKVAWTHGALMLTRIETHGRRETQNATPASACAWMQSEQPLSIPWAFLSWGTAMSLQYSLSRMIQAQHQRWAPRRFSASFSDHLR